MAGWASDPAAEEFRALKPNRELLTAIAQRTGGAVLTMADLKDLVRAKAAGTRAPITETWSDPLWHKPMVFLFVIGCFVGGMGNPPLERIAVRARFFHVAVVVDSAASVGSISHARRPTSSDVWFWSSARRANLNTARRFSAVGRVCGNKRRCKGGLQTSCHWRRHANRRRMTRTRLLTVLTNEVAKPAGEFWLVFIGHGTYDGHAAKFNLRGPDISAEELAAALKPCQRPLA